MRKVVFPSVSFSILRKVLFFVFLISITFASGYAFGLKGFYASLDKFPNVNITREVPAQQGDLDFSLFWRIWDILDTKYYDKASIIPAKLVYGAIKGMVSAVGDPYTVFLPPQENKVVQEDLQGSFDGVGIQIGFKGSQLAVIAPLPDSPAEKSGVQAGDFIIGIRDENKDLDIGTLGITLPEAVQAIRGPKGTKVTLTILREGSDEPLTYDITRDSIEVPSITTEFVGESENIAHVRLLKFAGETVDEWNESVVDILTKENVDGIIIDVRNNPGGYLQAAVDLSSDFLETGDIVVIEEGESVGRKEYKVEKIGRLRKFKTVVLINEGSASASEILAGALRDQKGISIIGESSFGKGTIQEPQQVDNGSGLHVTVARWLTPSEYWVNEKGIEPDEVIEDNPETEEDEQLNKAIDFLTGGG